MGKLTSFQQMKIQISSFNELPREEWISKNVQEYLKLNFTEFQLIIFK